MSGEVSVALRNRYDLEAELVLGRLRALREGGAEPGTAEFAGLAAELGVPQAELEAADSFYSDLGPSWRGRRHVRVCAGSACMAAGGRALAGPIDALLAAAGDEVSVQQVHCLGYCYGGPSALDDESPCAGHNLPAQLAGEAARCDPPIPFACDAAEPVVLAGLLGTGPEPWSVWERVAAAGDRERVMREVTASGLRGRGGAGFPAAVKWKAAAETPGEGPRFLIANGDEGDPGSFVDRLLMESDPHRLLEGMALAALGCGADRGIVYVRSEYPAARDAVRAAIAEARELGMLGSGFDVEVFEGAGSYVAGEETALIHSVEGLRGEVSPRPPFPAERGLLGQPTVVNNVETLASIPWIVDRGGAAYATLGAGDSRGTKVVCLNERFQRPGAYEVELGVELAYIFDALGGGLAEGTTLRCVQVGGPLGGYLGPDQLELPLTFEALRDAGADLGHGSLVAFDTSVSAAELHEAAWEFAAAESCGRCAPCRIGTRRGLEAARAAPGGAPRPDERLLDVIGGASLCAFGQSIPPVIRSLIRACEGGPA